MRGRARIEPDGAGGRPVNLCVIQARMGSSRLPGKMLKTIGDKTTIQHVLRQVKRATMIDHIVVATTTEAVDDALASAVRDEGVDVFRGSVDDVLDRYYQAALPHNPDAVVRITGDCPFVDPALIDQVIERFASTSNVDYVSNAHPATYPDGMDVEIISFAALQKLWRSANLSSEREHVTLGAWQNPDIFEVDVVRNEVDASDLRLTLDEPEDLELLNVLFENMGGEVLSCGEIVDVLRKTPSMIEVNAMHAREEGLKKSLREDREMGPRLTNEEAERQILELIPGGAHTYSKGRDQFPANAPKIIERGEGAYIWDVEGRKYLSWCMGLYSIVLGHAYKPVIDKVIEQLHRGTNFQRPAIQELEYAKIINRIIPCADMVKFCKNGSTATTAGIKLSRAYNGKDKVAICAQHPFFSYDDWFISSTPCKLGIPERYQDQTVKFDYNDIDGIAKIFREQGDEITALIMEPLKFDEPKDNFLHEVKALCREHNIVYILDEMITGFRFPMGGAQKYYGVEPDLTTFGKAVGNGFSISFLAGKRDIMNLGGIDEGKSKVFLVSTTHGAELHSIVASMATIEEIEKHNVIEYLWDVGKTVIREITSIIERLELQDFVTVRGHPYLPLMEFRDHERKYNDGFKTLFMQELAARGILFQGTFVSSYSHREAEIDTTLQAVDESLQVYKEALEAKSYRPFLVGPPIKPVFRKEN